MYLVKIDVKESTINGKGVFSVEPIKQGTVVWKFDFSHDKSLSPEDFENLSEEDRAKLLRVAYLSRQTNRWVYPPENDPALFTNHNPETNNMSVVWDKTISDEPVFVANRDIEAGEELTNNYLDFDSRPEDQREDWV